jgi:hypothetical protein
MTPDAAQSAAADRNGASGGVRTTNAAPILRYKTTPASVPGNPNPVVSGPAPLTVTFNLCQSEDPDPGDSLNWQFNFGDTPRPAFNPDGSFNPDFDHFCRTDHTYSAGNYVATLSVTDKHLEDQTKGVTALARQTQRLTIQSLGQAPPGPPACPTIAVGTTGWTATGSGSNLSCTCAATGTTVGFDSLTILPGPGPFPIVLFTPGQFWNACMAAGGFPSYFTGGACGCGAAVGPV